MTVKHRHLVVAAVLTAIAGVGLAALTWWALHDRGDIRFWEVASVRAVLLVVLSKTGLKVALAVVIAVVAGGAWLRSRHRSADQPAEQPGLAGGPAAGAAGDHRTATADAPGADRAGTPHGV